MPLKTVFKYFLSWRIIIFLIAVGSMFFIKPSTTFTDLTPEASTSDLLLMWSNFDGLHYQDIAKYGYGFITKTDMVYAFFPVYPAIMSVINHIVGNFTVSGLIISSVSLIFALYFLYKLILLDNNKKTAQNTIFLLLLFPTSFFFSSVYNESTFLLLSVLTFYFARKKNFPLASVMAMFASATRVTGIFLWLALLIEFFGSREKSSQRTLKEVIWLVLPPLGLLVYMYYQLRMTGDPFFFINYQHYVPGRSTDKLILIYQVFYRYLKMIFTVNPLSTTYFTVVLEFLTGSLFILLLVFSIKKIRPSYWVYCLMSFFLPTLTGTLSSIPRYAIVLFPLFTFLAAWLNHRSFLVRYTYYTFCIILSLLSIALFTRGYFIG